MIRLAVKLSLSGGREALTRLIVIAASVILGVTIVLVTAAGFNVLQVQTNRPCWECTWTTNQRPNVNPADTDPLLWLYHQDHVDGKGLKRLDVAALGLRAPIPPGIVHLPHAGEYDASPALITLMRSLPADELANRFPGKLVGTIGDAALSNPNELVAFVGQPANYLRQDPRTISVRSIETAPEPRSFTTFLRLVFVLGAIGLLFPMVILISTATRLSAARREQRFAAMRLVGATTRQVNVFASIDALIGSVIGTFGGLAAFVTLRHSAAGLANNVVPFFTKDFNPTAAGYILVAVGVPTIAVAGALMSLRRVSVSPLGVSRRATPDPPRARRLVPLILGAAIFGGLVLATRGHSAGSWVGAPASVALLLIMIGLITAGPWLTSVAVRLFGYRTGRPSILLAVRRLADNPSAAFRAVSGLVLAIFAGSLFSTLSPAIVNGPRTAQSIGVSNTLTAMFYDSETAGLPAAQGASLVHQLRGAGGVDLVPIYATQNAATVDRSQTYGVVTCADLRTLAALGHCPSGAETMRILTTPLVKNHSTSTLTGTTDNTTPEVLATRPLQALLATSLNGPATIERVRTLLAERPGVTQDPETFGEVRRSELSSVNTLQQLVDLAIGITLLVAGCSLAVAIGGGLIERRRPFALLRVGGMPLSVLDKVVLLESAAPLLAVAVISAVAGFAVAAAMIATVAARGTVIKLPGPSYYLTVGVGLIAALAVVAATLPLLKRMTQPEDARFE